MFFNTTSRADVIDLRLQIVNDLYQKLEKEIAEINADTELTKAEKLIIIEMKQANVRLLLID